MTRAPWTPDRGDGTYVNPVIHADYSDPDVIRVGCDYYLAASSFQCAPGIPLLRSRDLVSWELIGHALPRLVPADHFAAARPGQGVWAPALRHRAGRFLLYYPDPDFGLYRVEAENPAGPWSEPILVKAGRGLIDPCPHWDADGRAWLVHAWAKSRAGFNNRLTLVELDADGARARDEGRTLIDGDQVPGCHTLEGPKFHVRGAHTYVLAPAGGVATGWQSVFRARGLDGPWEHRIVLAQGATAVNGPHQGALVGTPAGEDWFLHFQDKGAYGRVVHLQPVRWEDDWPVIGRAAPGSPAGEPVERHVKPRLADPSEVMCPGVVVPATTDSFLDGRFGLQWQWQANPQAGWWVPGARPENLRLVCVAPPPPAEGGLGLAPNLLLQKFPAIRFAVGTTLSFSATQPGDCAGLMVFGLDWAWIGLVREGTGDATRTAIACETCVSGCVERWRAGYGQGGDADGTAAHPVHLRVTVEDGALCGFASSRDGGRSFESLGPVFAAKPGQWIGAKVGLFAAGRGGHADFGRFMVGEPSV